MLRDLIKKEMLDNLFNLRFTIALALCALLFTASALISSNNYLQQDRAVRRSQEFQREAIKDYANFYELYGGTISVSRPVSPLAVFFSGNVVPLANTYFVFSSYVVPSLRSSFWKNSLFELFSLVDLTFVISVVMSLVAVLFSYDSINGERERGTLKQILCNSVPRQLLVLSKLIGGYLSLLIPYLVSLLIALVIVAANRDVMFSPTDRWSLAAIILTSCLFLLVLFSLGVFASMLFRSSSSSLIFLLLAWALLTIVIPGFSPFAARMMVDVPSEAEIRRNDREIAKLLYAAVEKVNRDIKTESHELKRIANKEFLDDVIRYQDERYKYYKFIAGKTLQVSELAQSIARISPAAAFSSAATTLAVTGAFFERHFLGALADYYQGFYRDFVYKKRLRQAYYEIDKGVFFTHDQYLAEVKEMPLFKYHFPGLAERIEAALKDIITLIGAGAGLLVLSFAAFRRYDVR